MEKMKIIAYGDEKFSKKIGEMTVQISPLDYQGKKEVKYDPGKQQGQNKQSPVFGRLQKRRAFWWMCRLLYRSYRRDEGCRYREEEDRGTGKTGL